MSKILDGWVVIMVDDDDDNLEVAEQTLTFFGAQCHLAKHGQEVLELLESVTPTVILIDLSMPVMDGWELLRRLRENPATASITAIALTAHAMEGDKEKGLAAGFNGYITKPFRIDSFARLLQEYASRPTS